VYVNTEQLLRWTSRKFWACMLWQAVFCFLLWMGKVPPELFYNLTMVALGGYFAANVIDSFAQRGQDQK
jgi:hypothetical protein